MLYVAQSFEIEFKDFLSPAIYVVPSRKVWRDLVALQARVNGKLVWLLLDTSSTSSGLNAAAWKRLGLPQLEAVEVSIECGEIGAKVAAKPLSDDREGEHQARGIDVDGVLGLDVLQSCGLGLDLLSDVVALFPPDLDFGHRQRAWFGSMAVEGMRGLKWIPWSPNPAAMAGNHVLTGLLPRAGLSVLDASVIDGRYCLPVTIAGVTLDCVLDTTSPITELPSKPFEELLRIDHDTPSHASTAKVRSLASWGFELAEGQEVAVKVVRGGNGHSLGSLGMNVLGLSKVLIDFREYKISLTPYVPTAPEAENRRHYKAVIYDAKEKRILHFQGKARYAIHVDSIVLSGHSRIKVVSAKEEMITIDVG